MIEYQYQYHANLMIGVIGWYWYSLTIPHSWDLANGLGPTEKRMG